MSYAAGVVLFWADENGLDEAKAYIKRHGLTQDDVALRRRENEIYIVAKRDVNLCEKPNS